MLSTRYNGIFSPSGGGFVCTIFTSGGSIARFPTESTHGFSTPLVLKYIKVQQFSGCLVVSTQNRNTFHIWRVRSNFSYQINQKYSREALGCPVLLSKSLTTQTLFIPLNSRLQISWYIVSFEADLILKTMKYYYVNFVLEWKIFAIFIQKFEIWRPQT